MSRRRAVAIAIAPAVLLGAFFFGRWLGGLNNPAQPAGEGDRAPAYGAPSLAGDTLRIEDLRPDAVLLNIWATWCLPCVREMPGLDSIADEYGPRGLHVVGVSIDPPGSDEAVVEFIAARGIGYPILMDPEQRITERFFTWGLPETFLIDGRGRITRHWSGMIVPTAEAVRSEIEAVLPGG